MPDEKDYTGCVESLDRFDSHNGFIEGGSSAEGYLFNVFLASHLQSLQSTLAAEHEKAISSLQMENEHLRSQLLACQEIENGSTRAQVEENHFLAVSPTAENGHGNGKSQTVRPSISSNSIQCVKPAFINGQHTKEEYNSPPRKLPPSYSGTRLPAQQRPLQRFVHSKTFELLSGAIIMANVVIMALQMQYDGIDKGNRLEPGEFSRTAAKTWPYAKEVFFALNIGFNVLFSIELILRIAADRFGAFHLGWVWFDAFIVGSSIIDLLGSLPINPIMMRVLRLVRLLRLLKILKTMEIFHTLFLLIKAVEASWKAAIWSFLLLLSIQLVGGLFLCQALSDFLDDRSKDPDAQRIIYEYFGTFSKTMFTMFEISMANWVPVSRALIDHVGNFYSIIIILYRCLFCSAVVKVIAAVFITETYRVLNHDDDLSLMKHWQEKKVFNHKVNKMLKSISHFHSGKLRQRDVEMLLEDEEVADLLAPLGIEGQDLLTLFWLLEDGSGEVAAESLLAKLGSFKSPSAKLEVVAALKVLHALQKDVKALSVARYPDTNKVELRKQQVTI
mmetsp:Transcript_156474/g.276394  ORF Transcript_156474/g.276394 Transcript_156474/m.276394 type:complete len:559 (-) Transcript_156474:302-1978(-)